MHALLGEAMVDAELRLAWRTVVYAGLVVRQAALEEAGDPWQPGDEVRLHALLEGVNVKVLVSNEPRAAGKARALLNMSLSASAAPDRGSGWPGGGPAL